jgi:hypothetical protein
VWVAPLLLITALQIVSGRETIFSRLTQGDASSLWLAAVAALVCGWWWEMWNSKSLAHWEYAIPSIHRFQLFAMPLLGYAGYLPFGLECLAVTQWLFPSHYRDMMRSLSRSMRWARGDERHSERPRLEQQRVRSSGDGYFTVWVFLAILGGKKGEREWWKGYFDSGRS